MSLKLYSSALKVYTIVNDVKRTMMIINSNNKHFIMLVYGGRGAIECVDCYYNNSFSK